MKKRMVAVLAASLLLSTAAAAPAFAWEPAAITVTEDYMIPSSSARKVTDQDLEQLGASQLRIAKNEIYARHGRQFTTPDLQRYFNSRSWYRGTVPADQFSESVLSSVEKENIAKIDAALKNYLSDPTETTYSDRGLTTNNPDALPQQPGDYWYYGVNGYDLHLSLRNGENSLELFRWGSDQIEYMEITDMMNDTTYCVGERSFECGDYGKTVYFTWSDGTYDVLSFMDRGWE